MALTTPAELRELFALHDADRDGRLNARQFASLLTALGYLLTEREARDIGWQMDRRFYGLVTLEECAQLLRECAPALRTLGAARAGIKAALRTHGALPVIGGAPGAAAAAGPAAAMSDVATLRRLLMARGDALSAREFDAALRVARAAPGGGVVVGDTVDTDGLVDALIAEAERAAVGVGR